MRAFAGRARQEIGIPLRQSSAEEGMQSIGGIFSVYGRSGAGMRRFYELLKPETGTTIFIDGSYPVDEPGVFRICCRRQPTMKNEEGGGCVSGFCENSQKKKVLRGSIYIYADCRD